MSPHQAIDMGLEDAEIFVARSLPGRGQHDFDDLDRKRVALFTAYRHQGRAGGERLNSPGPATSSL